MKQVYEMLAHVGNVFTPHIVSQMNIQTNTPERPPTPSPLRE